MTRDRARRRPRSQRGAGPPPAAAAPAARDDPAARRSRPDRPTVRPGGYPDERPAAHPALALWAVLAVLVAARGALAFVPTMWGWGFDLQRFLSPAWAWLPWLVAAAALVPAVARRASPALTRAGEAATRAPALATAAWMAFAALLVGLLPDRLGFVGDFLLRQGTVEENLRPGGLFPQALPLDILLHVRLPGALAGLGLLDANGAARLIGALEAALLAALAVAFARDLARGSPRGARPQAKAGGPGMAAFATTAVVFFGGTLGLYTGYSKSLGELVLVAAAIAIFGLRALREGRGLLPLGVALALAALLHRSALGFVPAAAFAFALAPRSPGARRATRPGGVADAPAAPLWRRPATWAALALPVAAFAFGLPRMLATFAHGDAPVHFASAEVKAQGGLLRAAMSAVHLADVLSLIAILAPIALAIPALAIGLGRRMPRARELAFLLVLALPFVALLLAVHPAQGVFRDWDTFAETGITLSLVAAWLVGEALRAAPAHAWIGVAAALAAAAPSVQWLAHQGDVDRGLARVRAFLDEPPRRSEAERGKTWDYLGVRNFRLERWQAATEAFAHAAETQPSPRVLAQWARAATQAGDFAEAQRIYRRVLERDPDSRTGWLGLGAVSTQLGDFVEAQHALRELIRRNPDNAGARQTLQQIERMVQARRDSAGR
ncbi:MAG: tetratricopeptide repeat protein [Candidatus Eisenbacteria bacterium]|nr:tetratricopeptide repeat protein [Candidatus Eisenbacteria bacterium]